MVDDRLTVSVSVADAVTVDVMMAVSVMVVEKLSVTETSGGTIVEVDVAVRVVV
jgi:hypothetical protein